VAGAAPTILALGGKHAIGPCGDLTWSPIGSASSLSQLAGVVASLVFAGVVFLLQRRAPDGRQDQAIALLISGFLTFALVSFMFGVVAGEQTCPRAWTEYMVASGGLGIGTLGLFTSLVWLLHVHEEANGLSFRVTTAIAYSLAATVGFLLVVTARAYLDDVAGGGPHWLASLLNVYVAAVVILVVLHLIFQRRLRRSAQKVVGVVAYVSVAYIVASTAVFGWVSGLGLKYWSGGVSGETAAGITVLALALPGLRSLHSWRPFRGHPFWPRQSLWTGPLRSCRRASSQRRTKRLWVAGSQRTRGAYSSKPKPR
jgi:hypothetical protein